MGREPPLLREALESILTRVEKPARYIGHEWNARHKSWDSSGLRLALAYPDVYEVGMSNLGLSILYDIANDQPGVLCDRVYAPWPDMEGQMRARRLPLFGLESRTPLSDFDIIGFSLPYELNLTNILNMLDLAGVPVRSENRRGAGPLVIAGGSGAFNPEPAAPFFDLFVIGDGEEALLDLIRAFREWRNGSGSGTPLNDFLPRAARIAGIYVPSFYTPHYDAGGRFQGIEPNHPAAPARVSRRLVTPLPPPPLRPPLPYVDTVHNRAMIEIQRGCTQGCRFCHAGTIYRPVRERSPMEIIEAADALIANTGYDELGLLSLSSADHSAIEEIVQGLLVRFEAQPISISLPSLRIDSFSVELSRLIQSRRRTGLTFAPEAGSQRLRDTINKKVTERDLLDTADAAFAGGWHRIKLYFMIGLPTETDEDVLAIAGLVRKVLEVGRSHIGRRATVAVSVATFVPKPHTSFQWFPLVDEDVLEHRISLLRNATRRPGIILRWHEPGTTGLEAAISRGDRRLGPVIERAWRLGARFDAWNEHFRPEAWQEAFEEAGLSIDTYARRPLAPEDPLPWEHIDAGVSKTFLAHDLHLSMRGETLPDCRAGCLGCGITSLFDLTECPPATFRPAGRAVGSAHDG